MPDRLSEWAGARTAPDAIDAARLLEQADGRRPELTTKRSLVGVSHAIERAVLAAPHAEPTIVLALFQRMEYFERERAVYDRIARTGALVAVGFCDGPDHPLPDGVASVALDPAESSVNEWSVVAVSPQAGAFLVATDQHVIEPGSSSLEAGRRFRSRWGFSRVQATVARARLRLARGERRPAEMVRTIDRLLGETMAAGAEPAGSGGSPQEVWATTAAYHLAERLSSERTGSAALRAQLTDAHAAATARYAAGADPQSGLTTPEFLNRWSGGAGTTALPVGIGLFDLPAAVEAGRGGADPRAAYHAARRIAAAVTQPLGPVDAAVRLSEREFLVVLPGASELHLARVCDEILEQLVLASEGYPYVSLAGMLATTVTRHRPLPLADLRRAVEGVDPSDAAPRSAGDTASGDPMVVCATRSPDGDDPDEDRNGGDDLNGDDLDGEDLDGEDRDGEDRDGEDPDGGDRAAGTDGAPELAGDRAAGDTDMPGDRRDREGVHDAGTGGPHLSGLGRFPRPYPGRETGPLDVDRDDRTPSRGIPAATSGPPDTDTAAGPPPGSAVEEVRNLFGRRG